MTPPPPWGKVWISKPLAHMTPYTPSANCPVKQDSSAKRTLLQSARQMVSVCPLKSVVMGVVWTQLHQQWQTGQFVMTFNKPNKPKAKGPPTKAILLRISCNSSFHFSSYSALCRHEESTVLCSRVWAHKSHNLKQTWGYTHSFGSFLWVLPIKHNSSLMSF